MTAGDESPPVPPSAPEPPPPSAPEAPAPPPPAPAKRRRWPAIRDHLVDTYLTIDGRSLGLGRIALALVLLVDLIRRIPDISLFYSNHGLVPNHMMLWRPPTQWMFSFFFILSNPDEVAVAFVICGLIYLGLLVGWRTRLMQVLSLVCVLSLHGRVTFMENGGDWMLGELALWTAFLPLGVRYSVDAVRESLRRRHETTAAQLADRAAFAPEGDGPRVVTLAALALVLQIANSYLFNAVHKGGATWREGSAVHYVLHQDRMVTWFAVWMRPHMTLWLSRILSWGALAAEAMLPLLLLAPFLRTGLRRVAVLFIIGLHLGFQLFINLGIFSWAMISYTPFLLTAADWRWLGRRGASRGRRLVVYFDAGCGICFQIARVLARMDRFGRVRFVSSVEVPPEAGVSQEVLQKTVLVIDEATGRQFTRADGMAEILAALPVGWLWALPLRLPGLRGAANWGYDRFSHHRETISVWLGLAACGLSSGPSKGPEPPAMSSARPSRAALDAISPFRMIRRAVLTTAREGAVAAMIIVLVSETLFINQAVPMFLKHEQPMWVKRLVAYPRLIQAWSMFASDAPVTDQSMVIDAITVDGRHVDPYSEVAGRYPNPGRTSIPARLDNDSFFFNYSGRIPTSPAYHNALIEWVLRYHERTGRPNDRIVRFEAYEVDDDSPKPGHLEPTNVRSKMFLSYPPR